MSFAHILVVEDDQGVQASLQQLLEGEGYQVTVTGNAQEALRLAQETPMQVALTDLRLPDMDGIALLEQLRRLDDKMIGIMLTGFGTIEHAVQAMRVGAFDVLAKPFDVQTVIRVVKRAVASSRCIPEPSGRKPLPQGSVRSTQLVGTSDNMKALIELVEKVADSDSTVLIQGESGTGKEVIASALHVNSPRAHRPLVPINCGAIPENLLESELFGHEKGAFTGAHSARIGRFEAANGGTLFLDEIGEMSLPLQVKLLRVLQERSFERVGGTRQIKVDVRIIAATNQDLEAAVLQGRFRRDLFYRLNVIPLAVPPLRDRRSDIPQLIEHFLKRFTRLKRSELAGVDQEATAVLMRYDWPGNVRELENLIERLVVLKREGVVTLSDLPDKISRRMQMEMVQPQPQATALSLVGINLMKELEQYENRLIIEALRQTKGITSKAARLLSLNRTTLIEKLKRKGLDAKGWEALPALPQPHTSYGITGPSTI